MRIKSNTPLSDSEIFLVEKIMKESIAPNESLHAAFPDYHHRTNDTLFFGNPPWDLTQEIVV